MASGLTQKLGWLLAVTVLGAIAYTSIEPRIAYRLEQSSVDLSVLDAWYHRLSLDSVGGVSLSGDAVSVSGYWLGWFDLDARRRVLGSNGVMGPAVWNLTWPSSRLSHPALPINTMLWRNATQNTVLHPKLIEYFYSIATD